MADKKENERIRLRVKAMYNEFVSEVDPRNVTDLLIQRQIISVEFRVRMMREKTKRDRCVALLDHLLHCSNKKAFIVLREALQKHYKWIVTGIDASETDSSSANSVRAQSSSRADSDENINFANPQKDFGLVKSKTIAAIRQKSSSVCCICSIPPTTPRKLSCQHTACLKCIEKCQSKTTKKDLHCLLCKIDFTIPSKGEPDVQENFHADHTWEKKILSLESNNGICKKHFNDNFCIDCKCVFCNSCAGEQHRKHNHKDVKKVESEFHGKLNECSANMSEYSDQMALKIVDIGRQKRQLLSKIVDAEEAIESQSRQLKTLIEQHTKDLLDELSLMKQKHQDTFDTEIEEVESKMRVLEDYLSSCSELKSDGSPSEFCVRAENLIQEAAKLSEALDEYFTMPDKSVDVQFNATDLNVLLPFRTSNIIGNVSDSVEEKGSSAIVIGIDDGESIANEVIEVNLKRREDVASLHRLPTKNKREAAAAVYSNTIFVTGIGNNGDEIWKFDVKSFNWIKCHSMVKDKRRHSVAFVNHVLFICGGYMDSRQRVLDDVEAYDTINDKCKLVGQLKYGVQNSGNCVPFKGSLYIFGGCDDNDRTIRDAQVYDTKLNKCSLLSKPMPKSNYLLRAVMVENIVILLGSCNCFVYYFDTETWESRDQFKTNFEYFGLAAYNGKLFVIGGGKSETDSNDRKLWIPTNEVSCIPVANILKNKPIKWMQHANLPKSSLVHAYGEINIS